VKIRLYSHLQQPTGYGRAARELARAMDIARVELDLRTVGPRDAGWSLEAEGLPSHEIPDPDAVIVHTLPGDCHRVLEIEGLRRGAGPKLVAYTTWEALTAPPEVLQPLVESFDQIWVPSASTAASLATALPRTSAHGEPEMIRVIPHCYDDCADPPAPASPPDAERFRFYWIGAWTARKNPGGLIRAFALAFPAGSRAELVLHSPGCSMDAFVAALAATGLQQHELPPIVLSRQHLTEGSLAALHRESDCFVTAARGEAWNLPAFDAMLAGRHVIAQYGLGSDEFLAGTSADLIDGWESPAQVDVSFAHSSDGSISMKTIGAQGMSARSLWLEPNLCSLADAMRAAFESRKRTIKIDYNVAERFGYAAVEKQVLDALEQP